MMRFAPEVRRRSLANPDQAVPDEVDGGLVGVDRHCGIGMTLREWAQPWHKKGLSEVGHGGLGKFAPRLETPERLDFGGSCADAFGKGMDQALSSSPSARPHPARQTSAQSSSILRAFWGTPACVAVSIHAALPTGRAALKAGSKESDG